MNLPNPHSVSTSFDDTTPATAVGIFFRARKLGSLELVYDTNDVLVQERLADRVIRCISPPRFD